MKKRIEIQYNASNCSAQSRTWYPSRTRFTLNLRSISSSSRDSAASGNRPITGSHGFARAPEYEDITLNEL